MKLSIVLPTYNRRDVLTRTLPTIFAQEFPPDEYEIVIVVDGSTDGTVEMLRCMRPSCGFRVLEQSNQGQAVAKNAALKAARGELVLFLDDDILCDRLVLREHVAAHNGTDALVAFGPVYLSHDSPRSTATSIVQAWDDQWVRLIRAPTTLQLRTDYCLAPNSSIARSALIECGGFDERFARYREDTELGLRLREMGFRFRFLPSATVAHLYVRSTESLLNEAPANARNEVLLCRKHPDFRPYSELRGIAGGPWWKYVARQIAVRAPVSPEPLLRMSFRMTDRLRSIPAMQRAAISIYKHQRSIAFLRSAARGVGSWGAIEREFGLRLPVLMYHHVGPRKAGTLPGLTVSAGMFERQVRWLVRHGYRGISAFEWLEWVRGEKSLLGKPVLLTFDDAYGDLSKHALPLLQRYGFRASVFVVTAQIGGTNTWDEVRGSETHRLMSASEIRFWAAQGIDFGAHSRTHRDLTTLSDLELEREVLGSKDDLSAILGASIHSFAYPYGAYDNRAYAVARSTFDMAFTTVSGINHMGTDLHLLHRSAVTYRDSLLDLPFRLHWGWSPIQQIAARLRLRSRLAKTSRVIRGRRN